ncbi:MAG TPA: DinB family protein [Methylomirabilota bacterium]|jgi:hypothetical protein|nr:DinB family protein [Methylomirabilota bacterium]
MPTRDDYLRQSLAQRLARIQRTPDDLAEAIRGQGDGALSRRPDDKSWSAKEVVCHLRDIEELCIIRYHMMLSMDEPRLFVVGVTAPEPAEWGIVGGVPYPVDAERWAAERQYLRNDTIQALAAFRRRRQEVLALLGALTPTQWKRGGVIPTFGRRTFEEFQATVAGHDDNHLEQLKRALAGRP